MTATVRVGLIDDHPLVHRGLAGVLGETADLVLTRSWTTVPETADIAGTIDLLLVDLQLGDAPPGVDHVAAAVGTGLPVLVVSSLGEAGLVRAAIEAGAQGYLHKVHEADDIVGAIREVMAGRSWISPHLARAILQDTAPERPTLAPQEVRVLALYAQGLKLDTVARRIGIASSTAKEYLERVKRKYAAQGRGAQTKLELYQRAVEDGYLDDPGG